MWLFFTLADWRCTWGLLQCFADLLKERSSKNIDLRDNVQPAGHYCKINTDRVIQQHKAGSDFAIMTSLLCVILVIGLFSLWF